MDPPFAGPDSSWPLPHWHQEGTRLNRAEGPGMPDAGLKLPSAHSDSASVKVTQTRSRPPRRPRPARAPAGCASATVQVTPGDRPPGAAHCSGDSEARPGGPCTRVPEAAAAAPAATPGPTRWQLEAAAQCSLRQLAGPPSRLGATVRRPAQYFKFRSRSGQRTRIASYHLSSSESAISLSCVGVQL